MMEQDRFDNFIGRAAREVDPAPDVPREAMWQAIAAARQAGQSVPSSDAQNATDASVISIEGRRAALSGSNSARPASHNAWLRWGAPLAAMLILGIGLDRLVLNRENTVANTGATGTVAATANTRDTTRDTTPATTDSAPLTQQDQRSLAALNNPPIVAVRPNSGASLARAVKRQPGTSAVVRDNGLAENTGRNSTAAIAYKMAAVRHFERVQTLLVSMPTDAREGHINEIAVRAADLLVNTRLLLDSPAANDNETHRLLDDLELILAQVATISPTKSAEDVDIIQDAITKRDVLLRLHAVTAGRRLSGT